ncbi:MAG: cation:proton antiporter [Burkholderiales bacterium]
MPGHADLLTSIGICVSAAAVLAFIAHRLRQPLLLAYLLAGVIIGPQLGLGFVSDHASIQTVSEIGLILLLFIIGLELDLKNLMSAGKPVVVTGLLQVPLCAALGFAAFLPLLAGGGFDALYIALCLSMSSTMIVVKMLYDKSELDTLPGRITLGVLVFQDIWAILILGIQPNLHDPHITVILTSLFKGALLVGSALYISKKFLPPLFQSVAKLPELVLVGSLAWCFIVCWFANAAGLSREMGALIAGVSISTFPYNMDVIARVISIRDFFVTLFFVALGMQIPMPSAGVLGYALLASVLLMASRFVVVFPILRLLGLGHRASLLPAINLAQMSEFAMVIVALGLEYGHIRQETVSILIFVFAIASVGSTYLIDYSHPVQDRIAGWLRRIGLADLEGGVPDANTPAHGTKDVVLLGFFTDASALVHEFELAAVDGRHPVLDRLLVIDFNPLVNEELKRRKVACLYGDISHLDTLRHAHIDHAALLVSTIPDAILKGTDNGRLLRQARRIAPQAAVIVTANRAAGALELYAEGADYVFVPSLSSAAQMVAVIEAGLREGFTALREAHIAALRQRREVLA